MMMDLRRYAVAPVSRLVTVSVMVVIIMMVPSVAAQMVVSCTLVPIVSWTMLAGYTETLKVLGHDLRGR